MTRVSVCSLSKVARAVLAVLLGTALAVLCGVAPAFAHDALVGSDPVDGARLDGSPTAISLTFSQPPLEVDPQIVVTDAAGTQVVMGIPTVSESTVSLAIDAVLPNGPYVVAWRVVSTDGHPIQGTSTFTVADPKAMPSEDVSANAPAAPDSASPDPASTDAVASASAESPSEAEGSASAASPTASSAPSSGEGKSKLLLVMVILGLAVVAAALPVIAMVVRRRRADEAGSGSAEDLDAPGGDSGDGSDSDADNRSVGDTDNGSGPDRT